jgi:L-cysteine:1D-myo-inositol 2-amino-2-deoxy-alpha-D-glucopyranoside ligase
MQPWPSPPSQRLPGLGSAPELYDSAQGRLVKPRTPSDEATLYVCGITPYDATHIGHAFTYLAFDTLLRAWIDAGLQYRYVQNITDVDDPLLERANATHVDWRELARTQIELYKSDMTALSVLPPTSYVAVTETIDLIADAVNSLSNKGFAYGLPIDEAATGYDIYFDVAQASERTVWELGQVSGLELEDMMRLSAERGGDPERAGKHHPLDPLLWRAARPGEPSWPSAVGTGRPGWHIECSAIAMRELGATFSVGGGGVDLLFPHHEFSASHASALTEHPLTQVYAHAGLVSYQGEKMSKSRGNLVFVSHLLRDGIDPSAIRLALLSQHYRSSWEWFDSMSASATKQLSKWRELLQDDSSGATSTNSADDVIARLRVLLAEDLNTPDMIRAIDDAIVNGTDNPELIRSAADALLGIRI